MIFNVNGVDMNFIKFSKSFLTPKQQKRLLQKMETGLEEFMNNFS